jgi:predicted methyltransferase
VSVGESLHRIEASAVRGEVEAAGFVLESQSEAQRHPADDRSKSVFDESIRGRTDRFVYVFRKPRG